jgi:hypothetical protein
VELRVVSIGNALGESSTSFFALAVASELAILCLILRTAWAWPRSPHPRNG